MDISLGKSVNICYTASGYLYAWRFVIGPEVCTVKKRVLQLFCASLLVVLLVFDLNIPTKPRSGVLGVVAWEETHYFDLVTEPPTRP